MIGTAHPQNATYGAVCFALKGTMSEAELHFLKARMAVKRLVIGLDKATAGLLIVARTRWFECRPDVTKRREQIDVQVRGLWEGSASIVQCPLFFKAELRLEWIH